MDFLIEIASDKGRMGLAGGKRSNALSPEDLADLNNSLNNIKQSNSPTKTRKPQLSGSRSAKKSSDTTQDNQDTQDQEVEVTFPFHESNQSSRRSSKNINASASSSNTGGKEHYQILQDTDDTQSNSGGILRSAANTIMNSIFQSTEDEKGKTDISTFH